MGPGAASMADSGLVSNRPAVRDRARSSFHTPEQATPDKLRSRALPFMGDGHIPTERDRTVADDDAGLSVVIKLLLRAWPYIRPQLLGRWF